MHKFQTLVDSDAWIALYLPDDVLHTDAVAVYERLKRQKRRLVTTSAVIGETITVLSHRSGQALARKFLAAIVQSSIPVIHVDEQFQQKALDLFKRQEKKGTSFVDCVNAAVAQHFDIPTVLSFDKFYVQKMGLRAA